MRGWLIALAATLSAWAAGAADRLPPLPAMFMDRIFDDAVQIKNGAAPNHGQRQRLSLAGREDLTVEQVYSPVARPRCEPMMRAGATVDPFTELTQRDSRIAILMINEAHDDAQTRLLILNLLSPLRESGMPVYAAETFMPTVGRDEPKWPRLADGFYSYEPTFGEIIRQARSLGYRFVPYEADLMQKAPSKEDAAIRIAARETAQTANIIERIVKPAQQPRALIHAGHHHVIEAPVNEKGRSTTEWMASRFKRATGIDPLTVDQTTFQSPLDKPVVCAITTDLEKRLALTTDMSIGLPKPVIVRGRPNWRRFGGRIDVPIPARLRKAGAWSFVEARHTAEPADAVPADRLLIGPDEELPLILAPGKYRIEAWTRESGWSETVEVLVN